MCESDNTKFINKVQEWWCPDKWTDKCTGSCAKIIKNLQSAEGDIKTGELLDIRAFIDDTLSDKSWNRFSNWEAKPPISERYKDMRK